MNWPTPEETELTDEIRDLREELSNISMRREYTQYVKTERKIQAAQMKLNQLQAGQTTRKLLTKYGVGYGCQIFLCLTLFVLSTYNRYTPVIVFDDRFDFVPFKSLIRFPTGIHNALSVPFWVFVNGFVSKHVASYF